MIKKNTIEEIYGAGGMFYHGAELGKLKPGSLGSHRADVNFSRRMQALVPKDYYDNIDDDDEDDEILEAAINLSLEPLYEDEDVEEDELEEISLAGGIAIGTLPLGASTGSGRNHSSKKGGKVFPYTDKKRRKNNKFAAKTFGGVAENIQLSQEWNYKTLGKIKF